MNAAQGGGGYSNFFRIRRLEPGIYRSPQKISGISSTPKKYLKFEQSKKISQFCTLTLKKPLNYIEMTLKLAQFRGDPPKISTKSSYPPKIFIFSENPKNIEIRNFEPKKMDRAYVCMEISEYPPPPPPPGNAVSYETDRSLRQGVRIWNFEEEKKNIVC